MKLHSKIQETEVTVQPLFVEARFQDMGVIYLQVRSDGSHVTFCLFWDKRQSVCPAWVYPCPMTPNRVLRRRMVVSFMGTTTR